ncbi:MAG: YiiX/YebB-like N1pC/P60 family cysteine hydrolase [Planctomycetota bacterium]
MLFKEMDRKLRSDEYLTSEDQQALKRKFNRYRENRENLEQFISVFSVYSNEDVTVKFPATQPSRMTDEKDFLDLGSSTEVYINPHDDLGRLMILEIKMWLAAKLIIFDNYVVVLVRYRKGAGLRRQFNLDTIDPKAKYFLEEVSDELHDGDKFERTLKIVELVQQILEYEKNNPTSDLARDKDDSYLSTLIEGSYAYHRIPNLTFMDKITFKTADIQNAFIDDVVSLSDKATYEVSELFGNTIGLYEERKGKLYQMSIREQQKITEELKPLDILFEKTPFRLTDRFIPGHWGHVAIWVGDRDDIPELERLGVWQQLPNIEAKARSNLGYNGPTFQRLIERGYGILEALRQGVELNTFASFLNIDDLAVIRDVNLTDKQKKEYLLRAFGQIGKEYDFNFDVETNKRIVCSELAFVVYDDYDWPVEESVGRYTVSPDHVAALALEKGDPFSPILIYHDGKELPKSYHRENFKLLLEGAYHKILYVDPLVH